MKGLFFLIVCLASVAVADDFKTNAGKEYKNVTVSRVEPDGIMVKTKSEITKVYFTDLPKEVQERFHYDPQKATAYSAEQSANYAAYQKQQEEAQHQQEDAAAKNKAILVQQEAAKNRFQSLQNRYATLQREEDAILQQIGEAKQPGPAYRVGKKLQHQSNPKKLQLPLLQSHLSDVRREKKQVSKELQKAQR
jgi:site-specific DNA-cytosine methylase